MKVYWYKVTMKNGKRSTDGRDITQQVSTIDWSGSGSQVCRSLTVDVVYDPYGPSEGPRPEVGDIISLYTDDDVRLFYGQVTSHEKKGEVGTVSITCKDFADHLLRSKISAKYKKKTAERIAKSAAAKVGLSCGDLIKTKRKLSKLFATETEAYNIIVKAYKLASKKTGKKYILYMDGTKVCMRERGKIVGDGTEANFCIQNGYNLISASQSRDTDSMVNRVALYNANGKKIGTVQNKNQVTKYGVYQETQKVSKSGKKALKKGKKAAKKLLKGLQTSMQIEALGDVRCVAGAGVRIQDELSGIVGVFYISSDSHKWENGRHTMTLDLVFKNVMENPEVNYEKPQKAKKASKSKKKKQGKASKFSGKFIWPCKRATITSGFGPRRSPGGIGSTYHQGIDIGVGTGTKIKAAAAGKVTVSGWYGGYGKTVIIDHGSGYRTLYGHLRSTCVKSGRRVSQGQTIGYSDSTGNSTGPHLHFGIMKNGKWRNPRNWI